MTSLFPARYSRLDPASLTSFICEHWGLQRPLRCMFFHSGENDCYRVETPSGPLVLRVYRRRFSVDSRVEAELRLLTKLKAAGQPVSAPIRCADGRLWRNLTAIEGVRAIALFEWAAGSQLKRDDRFGWAIFGRELARLHLFETDDDELAEIGPDEMLWSPASRWISRLEQIGADASELIRLIAQLGPMMGPYWGLLHGLVHGDAAGWNAHLDEAGTLCWFDFLWTGIGPVCWDLATFRRGVGQNDAVWTEMLTGYESVLPLSDQDREAIPLLAVVRCIYVTAIILDECDIDLQAEATPAWLHTRFQELRRLADQAGLT